MSVQKLGDYWKECHKSSKNNKRDEQLRKTIFEDNVNSIDTTLRKMIGDGPTSDINLDVNDKLNIDTDDIRDNITEYIEYYKINHDLVVTVHNLENKDDGIFTMRFKNPVW